jgi:hypothetical protein
MRIKVKLHFINLVLVKLFICNFTVNRHNENDALALMGGRELTKAKIGNQDVTGNKIFRIDPLK